ncbi:MAG: SsrA-binding protein [Crocinitomicaceae bacterium]|nr:SsrA-binding protein [Crocinitomicaceae bacterium]|tara:strand:+ start:584 stop:766 length:183 start_codon:yes stop_codon:yes gene_type:complete
MNYFLWNLLSTLNKKVLPQFYLKQNLEKLSNLEKGIVGWKIFITYKFLDAAKEKGAKIIS